MRKSGIHAVSSFFSMIAVLCMIPGCDTGDVRGQVDTTSQADVIASDQAAPDESPQDAGYFNPDVPHDAVSQIPLVPSPSMRFEMSGRDTEVLLLDVVAKGLGTVFGVALRVEFDPDLLEYQGTDFAPVFGAPDSDAIYQAGITRAGQLSLGMTHKGYKNETELPDEVVIATISFKPVTGQESVLSFFVPRCLVVDRKLDRVEPSYLSATVYP